VAYGVVHDDYEGVAVVATGLAAPIAVAHSLVACQSKAACLRIGEVTHSKDRLALELIGPVATSTAASHHVVEISAFMIVRWLKRPSSRSCRRCRWELSVVKQVSSPCDLVFYTWNVSDCCCLHCVYVYVFSSLNIYLRQGRFFPPCTQTQRLETLGPTAV